MSESPSVKTTADRLRDLLRRCDAPCIHAFQGATSVCVMRSHYEVTPEHLLLRLLDDTVGDVTRIFDTFKVDRARIRRAVQQALDERPAGHRGKPALAARLVGLFESAAVLGDELVLPEIRTGLLILALVLNPGCSSIGEFTSELERIRADELRDHFQEIVGTAGPEPAAPATRPEAPGVAGVLEQFTIDLTARAQAGQIDPIFGREHEVRQIIDILGRRRKNNPIIVGEPGTGKTAVVEGLALRIVQGDVPPFLRGVRLLCLDLGLLQAGAGVKGEFENRVKTVIRAIKDSTQPIITFIDEAHALIGAGGPGGGDAANLLKPALTRGELRTIAATTWAEYKKYFEKDAALERRFQLVRCDEPTIADAIVMLRGLKDRYEQHHNVIILDDAVRTAVELSKRYVSGRFLPDKAVDLLDTAAARVAVGLRTRPAALEDVDRQLTNLDTGINALRRDHAAGMSIDAAALAEMEASRGALLEQRAKLEQRWQAEGAAIDRIGELRARLRVPAAPAAPSATDTGATPGAADTAPGAPAAEPPTELDQAEFRAHIEEAIQALRTIQGEQPLLHPHVDAAAVAAVTSDWTGIPVGKLVRDEIAAALQMEDRLRTRVVGQDHAIAIVAEKLRAAKAGLGNPGQPLGAFLCVGPSGVGKTELALAVADLFFGGERFLTSINMSEYMEKHTVSQLKGSPPGYVGYGEGGVLTEAVRQHPYSVVLLDEAEKAHPDVMNLFYQVFDKGQLADGEGRVVDFKNTVIFLTSNLGTDVIQGLCESGEPVDPEELQQAIYPFLREHFKPALVARMTVIPFLTLKHDVLKTIARMKLAKVGTRLSAAHRVALQVRDSVYQQIASRSTQVDVGARNIDHLLDQEVLPELARRLLEHMGDERLPAAITMDADAAGEFTYTFSDEPIGADQVAAPAPLEPVGVSPAG